MPRVKVVLSLLLSQHAPIVPHHGIQNSVPLIGLGTLQAILTKSITSGCIFDQMPECAGEGIAVIRRAKNTIDAVSDDVATAGSVGCHDC